MTGRFRSRMMRSGAPLGDRLQRGVAGADDLRVGVAAALERVLDQAGDVLLVFDDEDAVSGHEPCGERTGRRCRGGVRAVKCGLTPCRTVVFCR